MEVKKSSKANLENKKGIFFEIGLIVALACIFLAFEWKVDVKMEEGFIVINTEDHTRHPTNTTSSSATTSCTPVNRLNRDRR